jgi:hypothetical protein
MIARLRTTGLVVALLALLLAVPSATRAAANGLTLKAETSKVEAGSTLHFTGRGFTDNRVISVWASRGDDNYSDDNKVVADDDGKIDFYFSIPNDVQIGDWVMNAEDTASKATPKPTITASFSVTGTASPLGVDPKSGPRGTKFHFNASGFDSDKKVYIEFVGPDREPYKYELGGAISSNNRVPVEVGETYCQGDTPTAGIVKFCWQSPANAQPGRWLIRLVGKKTGMTRVIGFYITGS